MSMPPVASAQPKETTYTLLEPLPCIPGAQQNCENGSLKKVDLNSYISYLFKFSIALAAFLAVVMIIIGGFQYVTSDIPGMKGNAKEKIWNAVWGLVMVFASYLILYTIDPRLVSVQTNIEQIQAPVRFLPHEYQNSISQINTEIKSLEENAAALEARAQTLKTEALDPFLTGEEVKAKLDEAALKESEAKDVRARVVDIRIDKINETELRLVEAVLDRNVDESLTDEQRQAIAFARQRLSTNYDEAVRDMWALGKGNEATNLSQEKIINTVIVDETLRAEDMIRTVKPDDASVENIRATQQLYLSLKYNETVPPEITVPELQQDYLEKRQAIAERMYVHQDEFLPVGEAREKLIEDYRRLHPAPVQQQPPQQ